MTAELISSQAVSVASSTLSDGRFSGVPILVLGLLFAVMVAVALLIRSADLWMERAVEKAENEWEKKKQEFEANFAEARGNFDKLAKLLWEIRKEYYHHEEDLKPLVARIVLDEMGSIATPFALAKEAKPYLRWAGDHFATMLLGVASKKATSLDEYCLIYSATCILKEPIEPILEIKKCMSLEITELAKTDLESLKLAISSIPENSDLYKFLMIRFVLEDVK